MKRALSNLSIRWRLLLSMMTLGVLFSISLIVFSTRAQNELTRLALQHALSMSGNMQQAIGSVTAEELSHIIQIAMDPRNANAWDMKKTSNMVEDVMSRHPEINRVILLDPEGSVLLNASSPSGPNDRSEVSTSRYYTQPISLNGETVANLTIDVAALMQQEEFERISREMMANSKELIGRSIRISIFFLSIGIIAILFISTRLADPIITLTDSAQEIARGNFSATERIDTNTTNEIGRLSRAFVKMSNDLQKSYADLIRAADESRNTGAFLDSILENLPHMVFVKDAKTLRIIRINKAFENITGLPRERILHHPDSALFPPEQAEFFNAKDREVFAHGEMVDIPEEKLTRPDGLVRYLHTKKIPIYDSAGHPQYLLGISDDITEHKSAEQERRLFFNHSMDLMCIASMDGRFEQVNPAFVETLGYSSEELCTRPYFDFVHPDDIESTIEAAQKLNEGVAVVSFENRYFCKDGSIRWLTWNAGINREFKKVYAVARDTTDRRNMEERIFQAGLKEQERIAHDLHDGLGQILTALAYKGKLIEQMLRDGETPKASQASDIVALANRASEQARVLARGLDPVVLQEGLAMALRDLAASTTESFGIACSFDGQDDEESLDKTIANHLFRIAQEAVNNAIKHGHARNIRITLDNDASSVNITIQNDGPYDGSAIVRTPGLGVHTMNYRAKLIGGAISFNQISGGGLVVRCTVRKTRTSTPEIDDRDSLG